MPRKKKAVKVPEPQQPQVSDTDGLEILTSGDTDAPPPEPEPGPDYEVLI